MRVIQSKNIYELVDSGSLDANEMHWVYNALDSAVTLRVHERLTDILTAQNNPHARTSYGFVRAMQAPAMSMMSRGIAVNMKVRQDETERYTALKLRAQTLLDTLADAIWGPEEYTEVIKTREIYTPTGKRGQPLQARSRILREDVRRTQPRGLSASSSKQVLAFFNIALGLPVEYEIRKTPQGSIRTPTANDKALKKWGNVRTKGPGVDVRDRSVPAVRFAAPFVSLILTIRNADKMLATLRTPLDPDGRMRCSYNVVGTENGRWSSSKNAFGRGCVLADTEVLTPTGWRTIDTIKPYETVMQWKDGKAEWTHAQPFSTYYTGNLYTVEGEQIHQELTAQHRVLSFSHRGVTSVEAAELTAQRSQAYIPIGARHEDGLEEVPPFYAMLMADWSFTGKGWQAAFKKQRKIERFLQLASDYNIPFTEHNSEREGYRRFYISGHKEVRKEWGPWILDLTQESLSQLVEEARHWDSHDRGSGFIFFSANEECAKWFATAAHLCGRGATVSRHEQSAGSWSDTVMWWVNVKARDYAQVMRKHWSTREYDGPVYCLTVPSSFFFIRSRGKISITGNTNLQNIEPSMRRMFCADDGHWLVSTDLEQAESRLVAGLVWQTTSDDTYWRACESGDLHTTVARMTWPELGWTDDDKTNRKIADQPSKELPKFSYRDISKRLGHGSNYRGSPFGIAQAVGIPANLVDDFQRRYFRAFPAIPSWHDWCKIQLVNHQYLDTPLGRRRWFFGRPNEDSTLREAIAFGPQSTVGELLNLIMYRVWARSILPPSDPSFLPIQLLLQNHDAFAFQTRCYPNYHTDHAGQPLEWIIDQVNAEFLRATIPFVRGDEHRNLTIPGEFVTGFNWAYADKDPNQAQWMFRDGNPDGLRKWQGSDTRTRVQSARASPADWLGQPHRPGR